MSDRPSDAAVAFFGSWARSRHLDPATLTQVWGARIVARYQRNGKDRQRPALRVPTASGADRIVYLDKPARDEKTEAWAEGLGRAGWYGLEEARPHLAGGPLYLVSDEVSVWSCHAAGLPAVSWPYGRPPGPEHLAVIVGLEVRLVLGHGTRARTTAYRLRQALLDAGCESCTALTLPADQANVEHLLRRAGLEEFGAQLAGLAVDPLGDVGLEEELRETRAADERPRLLLGGDIQDRTRVVLDWLLEANDPPVLFVRGPELAVIGRSRGEARILSLDAYQLRAHLAARVRCTHLVNEQGRDSGRQEVIDPPIDLLRNVLAQPSWELPELEEVVRSPAYGPGGVPMLADGYYPAAKVWVDLGGLRMPPIPECPAREDVSAALDLILGELLVDFPFADVASRANALALGLLPFVRPLIYGCTPLHLVTAPSPGTGKGLLANTLSVVATGRESTTLAPGRDEEEWRKRITATLEGSPAIILVDNIDPKTRVDSGILASVLTTEVWTDRKLGASTTISLRNRSVWTATANNPRFTRELARRCLWIGMDAKMERPENRQAFRHQLPKWAAENRAALVHAFLVLVQAWVSEGMPDGSHDVGSFTHWSRVIGGILNVAGVTGFDLNREGLYVSMDDERAMWLGFYELWWERFQEAGVTGGTLWELAEKNDLLGKVLGDKGERAQKSALARALGSMRGRPIGRYALDPESRRDNHKKCELYRLLTVSDAVNCAGCRPVGEGVTVSTRRDPQGAPAAQGHETEGFAGGAGGCGSLF